MAGNAKRKDLDGNFGSEEHQVEMKTKETKIRILEEQVRVYLKRVLGIFAGALVCDLTHSIRSKTKIVFFFPTSRPPSSEEGQTLPSYMRNM